MAFPLNGYRSPVARRGFRLTALIAVIIGVLALAAAAFVLSYPGVRDTALTAGVTANLARIYPVIFDAMLVVACAAAFALQGARWWLRSYAWLVLLVIIAAVAAADSVHATSVTLPKRPLEATVAIVPWAVLLVGFTLLYVMARQAWPLRRATALIPANHRPPAAITAEPAAPGPPALESGTPVEPGALLEPGAPQTHEPGPGPAAPSASEPDTAAEPAAEPSATPLLSTLFGRPEPASDGARPAADPTRSAPELPKRQIQERDEPSDADAEPSPHFNRLRSTPTPPEDYPAGK